MPVFARRFLFFDHTSDRYQTEAELRKRYWGQHPFVLYFEMRDKPTGKPSYGALFPGVSPCGSGFRTLRPIS